MSTAAIAEKVKFTPGPWFVHDGTGIHDGKRVGTFDITTKEMHTIGSKWVADAKPYGGNFPDYEEARANAQLIAAAPDLLQTLIYLRASLIEDGYKSCAEKIQAIDAILKKVL